MMTHARFDCLLRVSALLGLSVMLAPAVASCSSDSTGAACAAIPCPAPGWDPVTCRCRRPDADASLGDGGTCRLTSPPACGSSAAPDCASTWAEALARFPRCDSDTGVPHLARCGGHDAVVSFGIDSGAVTFYDASGKLAGSRGYGIGSTCESYDASFVVPGEDVACVPIDGQCASDGGAPDAEAGRCLPIPCPSGAQWDARRCTCTAAPGACTPVVARVYDAARDCYGSQQVVAGLCLREMQPSTTSGLGEIACLVAPDGTRYATSKGYTQCLEGNGWSTAGSNGAGGGWQVKGDTGLCERVTHGTLPDGGRFTDPACDAAIDRGPWTYTPLGNPELTFVTDGGVAQADGGAARLDGGPRGAHARECP